MGPRSGTVGAPHPFARSPIASRSEPLAPQGSRRYRALMTPERLGSILDLDVADRILLVEEIWDSIAVEPSAVPVTDAQRSELDRRLDEEDPESPLRWDELRRELLENR